MIVTGRLGADVKFVKVSEKSCVAKFSVAETVFRYQGGESVETTLWHNIEVWNDLALLADKHLKKGKKVMIVGTMDYPEFSNSKGDKVKTTLITAKHLDFDPEKSAAPYSFSQSDIPFT